MRVAWLSRRDMLVSDAARVPLLPHKRQPVENPAGDRRQHHVGRGGSRQRNVNAAMRARRGRIAEICDRQTQS